jgi:hypothetical protein
MLKTQIFVREKTKQKREKMVSSRIASSFSTHNMPNLTLVYANLTGR